MGDGWDLAGVGGSKLVLVLFGTPCPVTPVFGALLAGCTIVTSTSDVSPTNLSVSGYALIGALLSSVGEEYLHLYDGEY